VGKGCIEMQNGSGDEAADQRSEVGKPAHQSRRSGGADSLSASERYPPRSIVLAGPPSMINGTVLPAEASCIADYRIGSIGRSSLRDVVPW
jgi:hypothetical protein